MTILKNIMDWLFLEHYWIPLVGAIAGAIVASILTNEYYKRKK